jgi:hypothetical protein
MAKQIIVAVKDESDLQTLREMLDWFRKWKNVLTSMLFARQRRRPGGGGGAILRAAQTQEAAQGNLFISVKLLNAECTEIGPAFDALFVATDGCTAANAALPRVGINKTIIVSKIGVTWYVITPTLTDSDPCTPEE